ncbi:DUF4097 family beta strand repeat-containing protein [Siminovitchia fortis]|uniref:DUF4097 family beta strand repeat-containing protein n=1 Tax=Siminovitchia fortis TaxID=254758 RepID=UPI00119DE817|nr:DUF4097 family beta strand repeat-containing protein [Siminovitchia fortis]
MNVLKKISVIALALLIVGIAGSVLTFKSKMTTADVSEAKTIHDSHFTKIDVKTTNSRIEIIPTKDSTVTAELSGKRGKGKKFKFDADVKGDTLYVKLKERQMLFTFDITPPLALKVYIPEKEYDSIRLKSDNGRISTEKIRAKEFAADTDNGRVKLKDIQGSNVTAVSNNGRIEAKSVKASSFTARSDNGKIILEDVEGKISGITNNGHISFVTDNLDRSIELETDNGGIEIQAAKEPKNASFDVRVDNGKVDIFGQTFRGDASIGKGENKIKLITNNGSVKVTK